MTGHGSRVRGSKRYLLAVTCISSALSISGCSEFRRTIGMERSAPDEFAVESRAPLVIPPDFDLRPPQPGAPRPQESRPGDVARKAIDNARPGEPGKQAQGTPRLPTGIGAGRAVTADTGDQTLSNKLLGAGETNSGAAVEKRETTTVKGVY